MLRFCNNEEVVGLRAACEAASAWPEAATATIALAWHMRQRDARLATNLAREVLEQAARDPEARPLGPSERGWLNLTLAETSLLHGSVDECAGFLDEAATLFECEANLEGLCDVALLRAGLASDLGDYSGRDEWLNTCLEAAQRLGDVPRELTTRMNVHIVAVLMDLAKVADGAHEEAMRHKESTIPGVASYANNFLSLEALSKNSFAEGIEYGIAARDLAERIGQTKRVITQTAQVSLAYLDLGDPGTAVAYLTPQLDQVRSIGWPQPLAMVLSTMAYAMEDLGRNDAALDLANQAVDALCRFPKSKNYLSALNAVASLELKCGYLDAAARKYEEILRSANIGDLIELRPYALLGLAEAHLKAGDLSGASTYAMHADEFAASRNDSPVRVDALRHLARISATARSTGLEDRNGLSEPLEYLRKARELTQGMMEIEKADELLNELSGELAASGQYEEAFSVLQMAMDARVSISAKKAQKTAVVAEIKLKTSNALLEASRQRDLAAAEAARASELEALNVQLRTAMDALQETQHLLIKRNEELNAAYATISELSLTDPLTGLKNRRFFSQIIDKDTARCVRGYVQSKFGDLELTFSAPRTDLVFFLIDLDHFKSVNDQYGHPAGDAVLIELKERLLATVRTEDYVVRWGGEEFLVVARGLERRLAGEMAERLRSVVAARPFTIDDGLSISKTCSIGFAAFPLDQQFPERGGWQEVVETADKRLYQAKRSGRNRCIGTDDPQGDAIATQAVEV